MCSPIQLKFINEYEPYRFKTLYFIHYNETIIDDLLQFYSRRKLNQEQRNIEYFLQTSK